MRRRLILRQGDKPPETPGPLSLGIHVPEQKKSVKGSQAAQKPRALDRFLPFRRATGMSERGPLGGAHRRRTQPTGCRCFRSKKTLAAATSRAVQQRQVLAAALWPVLR
jgi:hypothetical protein